MPFSSPLFWGNMFYITNTQSCCDLVELSWHQWHPGVTLSVCNYCVCPCLMCQYIRDSQIFTPLLVSVYFPSPRPNPLHQNHNLQSPVGPHMLIVFRYPDVLGSILKSYAAWELQAVLWWDCNNFSTLPAKRPGLVQFALVQSAHPCRFFSISVSLSAQLDPDAFL